MSSHKITYEPEDLQAVVSALSKHLWLKGPELSEMTGVSERVIRNMAEFTGLLISGNEGYCLLERSDSEYIRHHINSLRSRARKINARADRVERRAQLSNKL